MTSSTKTNPTSGKKNAVCKYCGEEYWYLKYRLATCNKPECAKKWLEDDGKKGNG